MESPGLSAAARLAAAKGPNVQLELRKLLKVTLELRASIGSLADVVSLIYTVVQTHGAAKLSNNAVLYSSGWLSFQSSACMVSAAPTSSSGSRASESMSRVRSFAQSARHVYIS